MNKGRAAQIAAELRELAKHSWFQSLLNEAADLLAALPPAPTETSDVAAFVARCREIRNGEPNAFYAHVDRFCKAVESASALPPVRETTPAYGAGPGAERTHRFDCDECRVLGVLVDDDGCCKGCGDEARRVVRETTPEPMCRCPEGVCYLHPSLKTCGMRTPAPAPPDMRAQIQALLARIDEWCGNEHDAEPIEFICDEIRPKVLALLDAQEPQR